MGSFLSDNLLDFNYSHSLQICGTQSNETHEKLMKYLRKLQKL